MPLRIVLTGASRGLGRAMVEGFVERGHTVIGCGTNADLVEQLRRRWTAPHQFHVVDVSDDAQVRAWATQVLASGPPDLLVNNAAVINPNAPLWQVTAEWFDRVVDVNLKGVANVIRHFVPAMVARRRGVIVNFSSGWGRSVSPEVAPYCATKWAIEGLTQALAEELPQGMAAIPLNPGIINTDMLQSGFGAAANSYPPPEQWAKRAVPLILKLGPAENGQPLSVPGG
jgi:NAD(P)-dependent dehydrogenase (short-subunit alcohol dehydrogenase family)